MLSAIRADLDRSPWIGEGHRKVWARLRVLDHIRVARKRVLRLMRENGLLSPHRHLPRPGEAHDGHITTDAPNLMWGTDATQIPTVLDGKVWLFAVVDHWNAEAMGWHVAKIGNRYAAAQAVGMAIKTEFNAVAAGIARLHRWCVGDFVPRRSHEQLGHAAEAGHAGRHQPCADKRGHHKEPRGDLPQIVRPRASPPIRTTPALSG